MNKIVYGGILIAIVIAISALLVADSHSAQPETSFGSVDGGKATNYNAVQVSDGYWVGTNQVLGPTFATVGTFTQGGGITASSTSASETLAGTEFVTSNVLDYTINVGSVTLTLNASTSPPCSVMTAGEVRTLYIHNATTTTASALTIAGGTGVILDVSSTTVIAGSATAKGFARLDVTKKANSDCQALMTNFD